MKRFPRSRMSAISLCVAVGVTTSACVRPDPPTVGMSKVEASLVFGVTDIPKPIESPIQQAVAQVIASAGNVFEEEEEQQGSFQFKKPAVPKFAQQEAGSACPEAPITAAALVAPQPRISGDPRPGENQWRFEGFVTPFINDEPVRTEFALFQRHTIQNFNRTSEHVFTFEEVRPNLENDTLTVTTYEVNNAPVTANPSDGVGVVATPGVGEPERGIVLTASRVVDRQTGETVGSFNPPVGLLMLPLPATAGEQFASSAVDPRNGKTISHEATVLERQRIDACGDLVDGWGVEYKRRESADEGDLGAVDNVIEITYRSVFATQYGGAPIFDSFELEEGMCNRCPLKVSGKLAQLEPTPVDAK